MAFAEKSKELREENNLTQLELATATKLSRSCISMIETGRNEPTASTLMAYAKFFKVSVDELLENEITPEEKAAGASATKKISITPIEDEMLYQFREVGKRKGEDAQRAIIAIAENMK